ncbi:hypothetical protein KC887_03930 [Candidatus Kaiserbacteria bacterium]|nr:hypothetical protein [Candidatus Kaiserbacteria bacterium]
MIRFLGFIIGWCLILIAFLQQWVWLAIGVTLLFSIRYQTHALLLIGLLLDGYFGAFYHVPVFSLLALSWFVLFESFRDRLNVSQE